MGKIRQQAVDALRKFGLYEPARRVWVKRPDIRTALYNSGYRLAGASDGLPIPPSRLIKQVIINGEVAVYLRSGAFGAASIGNALNRCGFNIDQFERILDFGCGCGRIIRQWRWLNGPRLYGTDVNADLILWCRANLGRLAEFTTNEMSPPLDYPNEFFDFIYSISVLTHLSERSQEDWMGEFHRVLKPHGLLLITLHGEWRINDLDPDDQARFNTGELIVKNVKEEGSNLCGAYHPRAYVQNHLARDYKMVYCLATGAIDVGQDLYLLGKK